MQLLWTGQKARPTTPQSVSSPHHSTQHIKIVHTLWKGTQPRIPVWFYSPRHLNWLVYWSANYACLPRATVREIEATVKDQLSYISHHFWFLREAKRSFLVLEWNNFFKMRIFLSWNCKLCRCLLLTIYAKCDLIWYNVYLIICVFFSIILSCPFL